MLRSNQLSYITEGINYSEILIFARDTAHARLWGGKVTFGGASGALTVDTETDSGQGREKQSKPANPQASFLKNLVSIKLDYLFYLNITLLFLISNLKYFMINAASKLRMRKLTPRKAFYGFIR